METGAQFDDEVIGLCERRGVPLRHGLAVLAIFAGLAEEAARLLSGTDGAEKEGASPSKRDEEPGPAAPRDADAEAKTRLQEQEDPDRLAKLNRVRRAPKPDTGGAGRRECLVCGELKGHTGFKTGSAVCRSCEKKR